MKYTTLKIIEETLTEKAAECEAKAKAAREAKARAEALMAVGTEMREPDNLEAIDAAISTLWREMQRVRKALADFNEQNWV